ncbi:MAG: bifunctional [glutamine synthetase] adenylyltransferase/[glutamine synthetase]-adenylyl-L-tyrosine phosphorylase [Acidobacteriota bacterium]|nr:bifunctional [glutamine synthetase] adenylyltransferase/[glutamine synthetase]-adenylyl-L-tyrosine phosphorylase [Acidobacteriota bacterium]
MDAHAVLRAAADRSAAPEAVAPVLDRLLDERPELADRLVSGAETTPLGRALVCVAGASNALARLCAADPAAVEVLDELEAPAPFDASSPDSLAAGARLAVLRIAARDLLGMDDLETVGAALAALGAAVLDAAVTLGAGDGAATGALAVIGMGKLGGAELNYASDVDVLFVGADDGASAWARRVLQVAGGAFRVDAALRPEGRAGPLARTLEGYRGYWDRWASAWEFQALLKARPVGGDADLGARFAAEAEEVLWTRVFGADELAELRAMKARAEQLVTRRGRAGRDLKLGPGGIRDVEFAVQLLQLVHGRLDPAIRQRATLDALAELGAAGYVAPEDAEALAEQYRFLRTVEHRLQLVEQEQTHTVPEAHGPRRRLARVLGFEDGPGAAAVERFDDELRRRLAEVRAIHERLYFRPLLEAFALAGEPGGRRGGAVVMGPEAIERRLTAFGFADAGRTRAAVEELAGGLSRSNRLMGQLLPLLLDWLSLTPDPDLGLLGLQRLATQPHHRALVVGAFRDSPEAARRLCLLLGSSRALAEALVRNPELISRIDDDRALATAERAELVTDAGQRLLRAEDDDAGRLALWRLRQDQFVRTAARDLLGIDGVEQVGATLTVVAEALLEAALARVAERPGTPALSIVGMGRFGGAELAYASDLDVLLVHDADGEDAVAATTAAEALLHLLHGPSPAARVAALDLGLRPEGAQGRLVRDVEGYRRYYWRWAQTWERQALVRARPVAGDRDLAARFMAAAEEFVWGAPLGDDEVAEIRRMKARVERERIPAREDPQFHLKLGRGSLSDVEWTVQLLQLRHGVRGPSTMAALDELVARGAMDGADAAALRDSYRFCEHTRNRWHLVGALPGGTPPGDALPTRAHDLSRLARSLATTPASLRDDYRRVTRRARRVTERLFYGIEDA